MRSSSCRAQRRTWSHHGSPGRAASSTGTRVIEERVQTVLPMTRTWEIGSPSLGQRGVGGGGVSCTPSVAI